MSDRIALFIYQNIFPGKRAADPGILKKLRYITPSEDLTKSYRDFWIKRIKTTLTVLTVGIILASAMKISGISDRRIPDEGFVRNEWNGKQQKLELYAYVGEEKVDIDLGLQTRELSEEELEEYFKGFKDRLEDLISGNNSDLCHVTTDLVLKEKYDGYPFKVTWRSSDPSVISAYKGELHEQDEERDVVLTALLQYSEMEWMTDIAVHVTPPELTAEEALRKKLMEMLSVEEAEKRYEKNLTLPETIDEKDIRWEYRSEDDSALILGLFIAVAAAIYIASEKDLTDKAEKKREELKKQYPKILRQLAMYVGAGMTVKAAFIRITDEGRKGCGAVYEEMRYTCLEMEQGIGEADCYERFGKRIGLSEYIKLSGMLSQNLKRGNSNFILRLKSEADIAMKEKVLAAKKSGELAQTKLLVPMMMELAVVMVMIMIPALTGINL
jgi:hypothetical protein